MLHLSEKVKITVFLVSAVILGSAASKHPNQRVSFVQKNVKRDAPVGNHFGGNLHGFGQQQGHQQFQLQALSPHQGLDGHQGSHFVMPHFTFAAPQLHSSAHQGHNFAHGGGSGQFSQLAKILTTQGQAGHGGHGGFGGAGFGHSFAAGGLKTSPVTFAAAPSTSYGTPVSGHFGHLGGGQSAGLAGHGFGASLQGLNLGGSLGHSLGGHAAFKGGDFGAGALSGGNYVLGQSYAPSFNALPQASSAQTVPSYAVGIKGLGHYSTGGVAQGGFQSQDHGSQASLGHGLTFDTSKYNIQTLSNGKTLAPVAFATPAASNLRHTSISNVVDMKNFKPSVLLGMYADVGNSGESHGYGGQSFSNLKFSQASLPSYSGHAGQSFDSGASYGAGYNTINYSEAAGH